MRKARRATFLAVIASVVLSGGAASAKNYIIYVGGDCATQWLNKAEPIYANQFQDTAVVGTHINPYGVEEINYAQVCGYPTSYPLSSCPNTGWINHDPTIDNTSDPWVSMGQLAEDLNSHCRIGSAVPEHYETRIHQAGSCKTTTCSSKFGCVCVERYTVDTPYTVYVPAVPDDTCVIVNHSGSDNVVRLLLATYDDLWNIRRVYTSVGAGGGSELASAMYLYGAIDAGPYLSDTDSPATCGFTWWMDVDTARSGYGLGRWAWDDTNGRPIDHMVANSNSATAHYGAGIIDNYFAGSNDHAVAFHSSLGRADVGEFIHRDDRGPNGNYFGHYPEGNNDTNYSVYNYHDSYYDYYNGRGVLGAVYIGAVPPEALAPYHWNAKKSFFNIFVDDQTRCNAHNYDQSQCVYDLPDQSPDYFDQFLRGFVKGGWCFGDCGPYY
jgi:hypothetical protein